MVTLMNSHLCFSSQLADLVQEFVINARFPIDGWVCPSLSQKKDEQSHRHQQKIRGRLTGVAVGNSS